MTGGHLYHDAQLTIERLGDWLRVTPVGRPVLDHESARAGARYQVLEIPLQRLAGVSHSADATGTWWLRFTGCFHGLHDRGAQEGTHVDVGPLTKDAAIAATGKIREAVPMPTLEPVASLRDVLGMRPCLWLTVVTKWAPSPNAPLDLDGAHVAFPRDQAPPWSLHGGMLSIRGMLESHGAGGHVLHVLSWTALHGDAVKDVLGIYSTLVSSDADESIPTGAATPAVRPTAAIEVARARPFDRFTADQRIHNAVIGYSHGPLVQIAADRWQVEDADLCPGVKGTLVLVCAPTLSRVELTIPLGADVVGAIAKLAFTIAQLSVYGALTAERPGARLAPAAILGTLAAGTGGTEPMAFVDGQHRVPFRVTYGPGATPAALTFHARVEWLPLR